MKKITAIFLPVLLAFSLAACGNNNQNTVEDTLTETQSETSKTETDDRSAEENTEDAKESEESADTAEASGSNILIAYFSVMETDGVDAVVGAEGTVVDWVSNLNLTTE